MAFLFAQCLREAWLAPCFLRTKACSLMCLGQCLVSCLVQVNAVLGPATRTHTIYEHIEVVVHPLGVHLTEAVAAAFWVSACSC